METVFISSEYITLGQFLKYNGLISNGSEAKIAVLTFKITINGESETRRGRKIYPGDLIKINKKSYLVAQKNDD